MPDGAASKLSCVVVVVSLSYFIVMSFCNLFLNPEIVLL